MNQPPNPTPTGKMPKSTKWLLITFGIVVVGAIAFGLITKNRQEAGTPSASRSGIASPGLTPSVPTTPAVSPGSAGSPTPQVYDTYEGVTAGNSVPLACNPTVSFKYPKGYGISQPYSTGQNPSVPLTIAKNSSGFTVSSVFSLVPIPAMPGSTATIPSAKCVSYGVLSDYVDSLDNVEKIRTFTTFSGHPAMKYRYTNNGVTTYETAIQNVPDKNIIIVHPYPISGEPSEITNTIWDEIVNSLKFK